MEPFRQRDDYEQVIGFLQLGVTVTAILLLSVSAIGMINIGLAGIEQCSHELLIRRALGATRASIAIQVIGSSVLLGLIIAFAAVLISAVLVWAIPWMMPADSPLEPPRIPIYGGDDCGLCVHRHLACRLSCPGHQSHTAATRAGVAMNQKPFWTSPPTAGWSAFRSSIASGKRSACGMCTMVEMSQPQNVDY
mgnify:CR=1 FL=1